METKLLIMLKDLAGRRDQRTLLPPRYKGNARLRRWLQRFMTFYDWASFDQKGSISYKNTAAKDD